MAEKLDIEKVRHIARLSRLELTNEEEEKFSQQLSSILDYVGEFSAVNTDNIEPTANITGLFNITRNDEVEGSGVSHQDIEQNAPKFENGNFIVPGIFE